MPASPKQAPQLRGIQLGSTKSGDKIWFALNNSLDEQFSCSGTPDEMINLVVLLLTQLAKAGTRGVRKSGPPDVSQMVVADISEMGVGVDLEKPSDAILLFRFGSADLGLRISLTKLGLVIDEFYQTTRRLSGRSGPPDPSDTTSH